MVSFYCTTEMWLFPDASGFQIKNLEAACATGSSREPPSSSLFIGNSSIAAASTASPFLLDLTLNKGLFGGMT